MILSINPDDPDPDIIRQAVEILREGGIIAYPTDTIYGLGCDIFSKQGIEKIYRLKGRDWKKPLSFMCADIKDASGYAQISDYAYRIMKHCLPGAYTFVLPAKRNVPKTFIPKQKTAGIRVPDSALCLALTRELGRPIITTSANVSGHDVYASAEAIERAFNHELDLVLDGGILNKEPSTVVDLQTDNPQVLREGAGSIKCLENI